MSITPDDFVKSLTECCAEFTEEITEKVRKTSVGSPEGVTSICADIRAGRRTEVDTISGSVVRAAKKVGVSVPSHEFVVNMIHALEGRSQA